MIPPSRYWVRKRFLGERLIRRWLGTVVRQYRARAHWVCEDGFRNDFSPERHR